MISIVRFLIWVIIIAIIIAGLIFWLSPPAWAGSRVDSHPRDINVIEWIQNPDNHPDWAVQAGQRCQKAPFAMPTSGFIGYLWDDTFQPGHRHQGLDIFGGRQVGETAVYAAADGYLSRLPGWKSSLIIRIPSDPLQPGRQIWTYYTHMAGPDGNSLIVEDFPPGSSEIFVQTGTLLGHQGNFSGTPGSPVGVHLHFSIVRDDGKGNFKNELNIENTLDPSPYLGFEVNAHHNTGQIPLCPSNSNGEAP
jgi:peptidoglycan LD-endopeptidase LytH